MRFYVADEVRSTESVIISSYPTSVSEKPVLLNTKHLQFDFVYVEDLNVNPFKHRDCILLPTVSKAEFCDMFPYLDN